MRLNSCFFALTIAVGALPLALFAQGKSKPAAKLSPEAVEQLHASEDTLALLAFAVVNDSVPDMRFMALSK